MAEHFYYLAAYTASVAAGLSPGDAAQIARAACCAERLTAGGASAEKVQSPGVVPALQYPPGDRRSAMAQANPEILSGAGAALQAALFLVCGPDGSLPGLIADWARAQYRPDSAHPAVRQSVGIALHALGSAFLHQGFSGVSNEVVNAAASVMTAKPVSPETLQKLLPQCASQPLETLFELESYTPEEPPVSFLGCGQLGTLCDSPARIYTYQSPWRSVPTVSCVNPLRFAAAYLQMRDTLPYICGKTDDFQVFDASQQSDQLTDLACFFARIPTDSALPDAWKRHFSWCRHWPEIPTPPDCGADQVYFNSFSLRLLAFRDSLWDACPALYLDELAAQAEPSAPEPDTTGG